MAEVWLSDILELPSQYSCSMSEQMVNEKQCFALHILAEKVAHYANHWWNEWFREELKSSSAARVGMELVKSLRKGLQLLQISAAKDSTVVWTIVRGTGPFREVIEDVRRYAQIMNRLIGNCSDSEKREIVKLLRHKLEFDCRVLQTFLGQACWLDRNTILEGFKSRQPSNNKNLLLNDVLISCLISILEKGQLSDIAEKNLSEMRFELRVLGQGSFGFVAKAKLCELPVAVKVLDEVSCETEIRVFKEFLKTDYPSHVVGILGCSDSRKIVLELMDKDLRQLIQELKGRPLPYSELIDIMIQIAEGMRSLHGHNVIYRDLKPANVLIQVREGQGLVVKLADFGVSKKHFETEGTNTSYQGTMLYMAPEMMKKGLTCKYTRKVDVHSFGMVCCEILTGKQTNLKAKELKKGKRPPLPENIPISLGRLIQRCWDQNPHNRPKFEQICDELWFIKAECLTGCTTEDVSSALTGSVDIQNERMAMAECTTAALYRLYIAGRKQSATKDEKIDNTFESESVTRCLYMPVTRCNEESYCICMADFELTFRSAIEFSSYAKLQETLSSGPRKMVGEKYLLDFSVERLRQFMRQNFFNINAVNDMLTERKNKVKSVVENERQKVKEILAEKAYSKWSSRENIKWENFCVDMESSYCRRVQHMRDGVPEFEAAARNYEIRMKAEIVSLFTFCKSLSVTERNDQFVNLFNRILMEAEKSYPPLAEEVNKKVHEAYTRMVVAEELNLAGCAKDSIQGWLRRDLDNAISARLKHVKQYSEVDVEQIIAQTKEILNNPAYSTEMRQTGHRYVKDKTTGMMVKIQEAWDQEHNICEKLSQAKGRLQNFSDACANHIGTGKILISELKHLLTDQIEVRHHDVVVRRVSDVLQTQPWVLDWKKLRACLDLHLLVLLDKKDERIFEFVGDVAKHYSEVSTLLVGKEIQKIYKEERQKYMHSTCEGLNRVAQSFRRLEQVSVKEFLQSLRKILGKDLAYYGKESSSLSLGSFIVSHIGDRAYEGGSAKLDSECIYKDMNQVCEELMNESNCAPPATMSKTLKLLVNKVMKRMENSYVVRPRCSTKCQGCGHVCYLVANHGSLKHDTAHQISGLNGVVDEKTGELWKWSCYDDVQKKNRFKHQEDWHNANELADVFNEWRNPTPTLTDDAARSLELREHIFYHYQKDLARLHNCKPCKDIPKVYNRDLRKIRSSLKNELEEARYDVLYQIFVEDIEENRAHRRRQKERSV